MKKIFIMLCSCWGGMLMASPQTAFIESFTKGQEAYNSSNFEEANLHLQKAISMHAASDDSVQLGESYLILSILNGQLSHYKKSEQYALLAERVFKSQQADALLLRSYLILGNLATLNNQSEKALKTYQSALSIAQTLDAMEDQISLLNNMGVLLYNDKKYAESIVYYEKALKISEAKKNCSGISMCKINIGISYADMGKYVQAIKDLKEGIANVEGPGNLYYLEIGYEQLARIHHLIGKDKEAFEYLENYMMYKDSLGSSEINKRIIELEAKYDTQRKELEILELKKAQQQSEIIALENENKLGVLNFSIKLILGVLCVIALMSLLFYRQYKSKLALSTKLSLSKDELEEKNTVLKNSLELNEKLQSALKQDLDNLKQLAYRKQMNPHFVFNSLNAVQNYILTNDKFRANYFLGELSTLVRRILENSEKDFISLKEELLVCETYIKLEQERFDGAFHYQIHCEEGLELLEIQIPPLLLQPFIENAIWHGLMHKPDNGMLLINISKTENESIQISIRDNGPGRHVKKQQPSGKAKKQSMGINLTMERIDISNCMNEANISLEIIDHRDEQGEASGTEVVFVVEN